MIFIYLPLKQNYNFQDYFQKKINNKSMSPVSSLNLSFLLYKKTFEKIPILIRELLLKPDCTRLLNWKCIYLYTNTLVIRLFAGVSNSGIFQLYILFLKNHIKSFFFNYLYIFSKIFLTFYTSTLSTSVAAWSWLHLRIQRTQNNCALNFISSYTGKRVLDRQMKLSKRYFVLHF